MIAASTVLLTVPSPLEGEGGSIFQLNRLGEGSCSVDTYPSPNFRCCTAAAALSLKGRGHNHDYRVLGE
jgi:hypothetical protein